MERRTNGTKGTLTTIGWIALILLIVGGVNWGLVGLFRFDFVAALFGEMTGLSRIIYVLVGLAALYSIFTASRFSGKKAAQN
ncbi:MAG: DUF378 domain-containing protein [Pseudomonadota bacterium]